MAVALDHLVELLFGSAKIPTAAALALWLALVIPQIPLDRAVVMLDDRGEPVIVMPALSGVGPHWHHYTLSE